MRILALFLITFLSFNISACAKESANDKILNIQEVSTKSSITAWLVEDHSLPIISLKFSFRGAGSIQNSEDKQGLARLLSNTMDEGAGDLTSQEFQKQLSDNSITLNFTSNRDNFGGQVKTLSRNKDKAFNLLKLALNQPRFDAEPLERMKQANLSRIKRSIGQPDWINARIFNDIAFNGHPYALNSGGTLTTLTNITADDLKTYKKNWLTQDRLVIAATGNITKKELIKIIDNVFSALPQSGLENKIQKGSLQNKGKTYLFEKDIPQTIITAALPSIDKNSADYDSLQLLNYIYGGGGFGSRLMEEAREKRGLTYGIYSQIAAQDYLNTLNISTSTQNKSVGEMLGIIKEQMNLLRDTDITMQELTDAKSYIIGSMPLSLSSTDKVSGILLGLQLDNRPIDYLDTYQNRIEGITIEDLKRLSNELLNPQDLLTILVGKPENINNTINITELPNVE